MNTARKIIHIDMDAFYAAVEQRDRPELRGKPVIVGGAPDKRGVVATASYEARPFGIHSAMPAATARRLCPHAVFLRPRFEVYRQVSRQIRAIFQRYTEQIEPLSLDEAYLDVTDSTLLHNSASLIAQDILQTIQRETRLSASAGVSYNKFLAKLASEVNKPNGFYLITPEQGPAFVEQLPIGKFHGIGKKTEAKMQQLGIRTGADLKNWPLERLLQTFGKVGQHFYHIARGLDARPVVSERPYKSLGSETTFEKDLDAVDEMLQQLRQLAADVVENLQRKQLRGYTVTLKVKFDDFQQVTRSQTVSQPLLTLQDIDRWLPELLRRTEAGARKVRLLGVTVSNFAEPASTGGMRQLELF
ncbi:MAG: DNA polymerase IV [Candidatus Competibacteraceae bacterium]|nr:DNA polymerase IV [Candidatus Competibacteraceae bacterium]